MKSACVFHLACRWERGREWISNLAWGFTTAFHLMARYPLERVSVPSAVAVWSTPSALPNALELLRYWGYAYYDALVWDAAESWELCVVGVRGLEPCAWRETQLRGRGDTHRRVPTTVYRVLEMAFPNARYYELGDVPPPRGWLTLEPSTLARLCR